MTDGTRSNGGDRAQPEVDGGVLVSGRRVADVERVRRSRRADRVLPCLRRRPGPQPDLLLVRTVARGRPGGADPGGRRASRLPRSGLGRPPGSVSIRRPGVSHAIAITAGGELRKQSAREFARLSPSRACAPCSHGRPPCCSCCCSPRIAASRVRPHALDTAAAALLGTGEAHDGLAPDRTPLAIARRAAAGLAVVGATEPLELLGLTAHELTWWTALGQINGGELRGAVTTLGQLPPDRYPMAIGLLLWCSQRVGADLSARIRAMVTERLEAAKGMRQVGTAIAAAGLEGPMYDWLWSSAELDQMPADAVPFASPALDALRALARPGRGAAAGCAAAECQRLVDRRPDRPRGAARRGEHGRAHPRLTSIRAGPHRPGVAVATPTWPSCGSPTSGCVARCCARSRSPPPPATIRRSPRSSPSPAVARSTNGCRPTTARPRRAVRPTSSRSVRSSSAASSTR